MDKFLIFFVLVIITNEAVGKSFRLKRQSPDDDDNTLDDRYGWDRPRQFPQWSPNPTPVNRPWQNQNQGNLPWQNQNQGNLPWQNQNQGNLPWQNPNQGNRPWQNPNQNQGQQPTPSPNVNGSTTQSSTERDCIRRCPVTSEYNPVCGSNGVTYPNPGGLNCAQSCGVSVSLARSSPCPTPTTAAPAK